MEDGRSRYRVPSPPIHQLNIERLFHGLSQQEKLYAHHMARAAWHGTRIILRQVSPESTAIFDFIMELYASCSGNWKTVIVEDGLTPQECTAFLEFASTFLSNIGNYYGSGDQKFVPNLSTPEPLKKLAARSSRLQRLYSEFSDEIFSIPPFNLGFPSDTAQSTYYPSPHEITSEEVEVVSKVLQENSIFPENTRIHKSIKGTETGTPIYEVLVASAEDNIPTKELPLKDSTAVVRLVPGDHCIELKQICSSLSTALDYAANDTQKTFLSQYIESFRTGSLHVYRDSQRSWVKDKAPRVENIFGFVEPYRDPHGTRAEFEGLVAISDSEETKALTRLVENSAKFIRRLPWASSQSLENDGKGPFEKELFDPPDFASIHALAYCSSIIFPGINLPNYNDIRQECGFKNVIVANRMTAESSIGELCPFIDVSEAETFQKHKFAAYYWWVVLHELLGHGTGKMMIQEGDNQYNFDSSNKPINPLTKKPITSWYKPGQTWTSQFADLATTVDECRAELVGAYLMDDPELVALFGFTPDSEITNEDLTYNLYLQLGVDGLRGLRNFNTDSNKWGQAHSRAHFAMLRCLVTDGGGCVAVKCIPSEQKITVQVDRSKIQTHGKVALGRMLLRLHMYRCTADVKNCRSYYEDLSQVDGEYLEWRNIVIATKEPRRVFVQANTFLDGDQVTLKEYSETVEGVIQSWAERAV